ncbi:MAG TPA: DNA topoisomerase IB [Solirubrobacteraceae bacterium]|jgi:DNA topoisomerase IB
MTRLRRADCSGPGIARRRAGRGFSYRDEEGSRVTDEETLARIRELGIPPAWQDVWICPSANGHLQATGTDAAGRKQYLYHPAWRARRDAEKFADMERFARALPALRERVADDLAAGSQLTRERVLACAVRLLDRGFFRIGTEEYTVSNESYGLATMRKEHVSVLGDGAMVFDYPAKSGQRRVQEVVDLEVADIVGRLRRRRGGGAELLAYKEGGRWRDIRSPDINAYLKEATGDDFSAKDFRTWSATVLAAVALSVSGPALGSKTSRKRAEARAVKEVSHYLGNTPAVARASYIDPRVFDAYRAGLVIRPDLHDVEPGELPIHHRKVEEAVLDLIDARATAPGVERIAA